MTPARVVRQSPVQCERPAPVVAAATLLRRLTITDGPDTLLGRLAHDVLTIIEAVAPDKAGRPVVRIRETDQMIEVRSAGRVVQIVGPRGKPAADQFPGLASDGRLLYIVPQRDEVTHAGTFGATWLQTLDGRMKGEGFLRWRGMSEDTTN